MEAQRCHSRILRLLLLRQKRWTVSFRTQVAVTVLGQGYDDANLRMSRIKNLLVAWRDVVVRALAAPPPSKQLSMWRQLQLHTEMSGMQPRSKGRGARPNNARHSLGAFCSMHSVLDVLFYSFLPKRGQQGDWAELRPREFLNPVFGKFGPKFCLPHPNTPPSVNWVVQKRQDNKPLT